MRRLTEITSNMRSDNYAWLHAKLVMIVWGIMYLTQPPPGPQEVLGKVLPIMSSAMAATGAAISVFGLIKSTNNDRCKRHRGYQIEIAGLIVALCGPATNVVVQFTLGSEGAYTRAVGAYLLASFVLARIFSVHRAMRRQ